MTAGDVAAKQKRLWEIVAAIRESVQKHARGRFTQEVKVERANLDSITPGDTVALGHVLWMCGEIDDFIKGQRWDKANRWIGFAQGVLWITGVASIDESRVINEAKPCATCGKPGHRPMDHAGWDPTKEGHG